MTQKRVSAANELAGLVLDGEVVVDEPALRAAGDDFGHIVRRRPLAVVRPGSVEDVAQVISFARARGLKLASRGQGHATYGQSQAAMGLVMDLRGLAEIGEIGEDRVRVGAGALWRDVLRATLERGLRPPVLTDYLGLTVGGTLSVGGIGNTTYRHGAQVDNVLELEVVTGVGERIVCSATRGRELFEAVLAGQGQCAVIMAATLRLVPAAATVRVFHLFYSELAGLTRELVRLVDDDRFASLSGLLVPSPALAGGWAYVLEALGTAGDDATRLAGLGHVQGMEQAADVPAFEFADRITQKEAEVRAAGLWDLPHPWVDLFVPAARVDEFVASTMAGLTPADVGPLPVMLYPLRTARLTRPLLRVPTDETVFLFDLLRTAAPPHVEAQVTSNRALYDRNCEWGGTHYPIGAIPLTSEDWRAHYGMAHAAFLAAKTRFDPDGVLGPGPGLW